MLNRSRMPPEFWAKNRLSAIGSIPGIGTKLMKRNTISAPTVNQMRCLSSVALEKLARLRLLAILSERDAIGRLMPYLAWAAIAPPPSSGQPYRGRAGMQNPRPAIPSDYLAALALAL